MFNAATPLSSGDWLDPARWTDGIIPGLSDSVTISSGTCVVSNYLDVKSVTVGGSANLLVADYGTSGGYAREITAKLTDGNLVVAQGGVAAFGGTTATAAGVKAQTYSTAHFPSRVSLSVAGCVTNSGSLSVGGRGGIYITNTLGVVVSSEFVMANGSVTAIYAGRAENPLILTGLWSQASVVSASRFELLGTAVLYSENDGWSGNPVRFETDGDLTVGASARVDTISRGYNYFRVPADMSDDYPADMPYVDSSFRNFTYAPGRAPAGAYVIAAHGGGGNAPTYGWPLAAYLPGSPGNLYSTMHRGSGSIVVIADRMKIDGTLTAFGGEYNDHGSPSAGGIMLVAGSYEFSPEAIITAEGPYNRMSQMSGAYGAGGRVSILCSFGDADLATIVSGAAPGDVVIRDAFDYEFSASIDALSGKNINLKRGSNNGTTCFARPVSLPVFLVAARSNNGTTGNDGMKWDGVSAGYGTRTYASGATVTLTQTATAPIVADGSVCVFAGYEAYDINDRATPVNTGAVNAVTLTVDRDWLVVWLYNVAGFVMTVPSSDQGSIVYAGPEGDETYANGAVAEIVVLTGHETGDIIADPAAGYEFLCWDGDVPFGMSAQNPIRFTGDAERTIRPVFREAQSATTRTFTAGSSTARGYWTNPSFWTPAGIPGPNDDVIINAGECVASNYIAAKSITINTDGKLKVGGHGKNIGDPVNANERSGEMNADIGNAFLPTANEILHETRVVVSGNVTLNDNGQLGIGGITPHQRWQDVSIGGNLTLNGTSVMLVSGGETNATFNHITGTAWLRIGGVFAINDTAKFVPQSERYTGGSVKVACRRFVLAADAKVDALRRGYGQYLLRDPTTLAPGGSSVVGAIAAGVYGGTGGKTYGYEYAPIHPGSPRGTYNTGFSSGGGLIRIHASSMEIAGTLDANAGDPTGADYGHGGASGGGIWLTAAQTVKYSGTPSILARGQRAHYSAAGGGGRIAITLTPDQRIIDQLTLTGTHPEVVLKSIDRTAFTNAFPNVSASADVDRSIDYSASSPDGTFSYTDLIPRGSLIWLE